MLPSNVSYGHFQKVLILHEAPLVLHSAHHQLTNGTITHCTVPPNVEQFNHGLFGTLLALSCLEVILCAFQMINGLIGSVCGTCTEKQVSQS